jgi:hypothetical protein
MSGYYDSKTESGECARCGVRTTWTRKRISYDAGWKTTPREHAKVCSTCWLDQHPDDREVQVASSMQKERAKRKREYTDEERRRLPDPRDRGRESPFTLLEDFDDDQPATEDADDDA